MIRTILTAVIIVGLAVLGYFYLKDGMPGVDALVGFVRGSLFLPLILGVLGGVLGSLLFGRGDSRIDGDLEGRVANLELALKREQLARQNQPQPARPAPIRFVDPAPQSWDTPTPAQRASEPVVHEVHSDQHESSQSPEPSLVMDEIMERYRAATSGALARSTFTRFLDGIGKSGPVEIKDGGMSLQEAQGSETFLTSVTNGGQLLVFPSYSFLANQDTQFNTIASVPEDVACTFHLRRGDGEIALLTPAVYQPDGEGRAELITRGEITGFAG